jgi:tRNA U55 pseudouridine synthase TruB
MHCTTSSGTYIRSLARDIAARLGTCGHLTSLRRTSIGAWSVPEIAGMAEWGQIIEARADFEMLDFFPSAHVTHAGRSKVSQRKSVFAAAKAFGYRHLAHSRA